MKRTTEAVTARQRSNNEAAWCDLTLPARRFAAAPHTKHTAAALPAPLPRCVSWFRSCPRPRRRRPARRPPYMVSKQTRRRWPFSRRGHANIATNT